MTASRQRSPPHQPGIYPVLPKRADFATVRLGFWGKLRAEAGRVETMVMDRGFGRFGGGCLGVCPDAGTERVASLHHLATLQFDAGERAGQVVVRAGDLAVAAGG